MPYKPKNCRYCTEIFTPDRQFQRVCSPSCAIKLSRDESRLKQEKAARRALRARKEALKGRSDWMKEAQVAFNAYIRARDAHLGCVSCGKMNPGHGDRGGLWDAGHYLSRGAHPELRFEEANCHKQCKNCNQFLSGNMAMFRLTLIGRLGEEKLAWLEGPHEPKKYTIEDLKEIKRVYKEKLKALKE